MTMTHTVGRSRRKSGLILPVNHLDAEDIKQLLPPGLDYSFAVVRNPMKRIISQYHFQTSVSLLSRFSFSTWLRVVFEAALIEPRLYDNHIRPQSDLIPDTAKIFRLEDGWEEMIKWFDEVTESSVPNLNVGHLLKSKKKALAISLQDVEMIENFYRIDYDRLGYSKIDKSGYKSDRWARLRMIFAKCVARILIFKQHRDWGK